MNSKKTFLTLGMAIALTLRIVIIFASPLSATTSIGSSSSMTMMLSPPPPSSSYSVQQQHGGIPAQNDIIQPGLYARGTIASLQNDKDGKPAWLVSGIWRGSLTNMTSNTMSSLLKNLPTATFNAVFNMVMLNGSALHKHQISNFILIGMSMPNEKTVIYNGTATITMKEGQVNDVPLSIRTLDDNVISIWIDPAKTMNHFGNTPIYGTIIQDVLVRK
ncbi:MAG: hypothetical protein ACJ712_04955 [Nitrososphaeraceae archaeon]